MKTQLESMKSNNALKNYVIEYILNNFATDEEIKGFIEDLMQHDCVSGIIGTLIYYTDTHKFYEKYYEEIEELRKDLEEQFGEPVKVKGDIKNFYAWLAFEETARIIATELEFDI